MPQLKSNILIVDDKPENLFAMEQLLKSLDEVAIYQARSGAEALQLTLEHSFCLAIVDIQMPEMDGYELVELIRANQSTANLPVIFVSAIFSDEYHHRKGYEAGAVDFLSKPFDPEILLSKIKVFLALYQQRRALEQANADKDMFFSIISNDLRSPFNNVLANSKLMDSLANVLSPKEIQEMSHNIYGSAQAAYNLLENLLMWVRMQRESGLQQNPEVIPLAKVVAEELESFQQVAAHRNVELQNTIDRGIHVLADRQMLEIAIRNLVENALNFTRNGERVILKANDDPGFGMVTISVQDTGVGIPQADVAKLFEIEDFHAISSIGKEQGSGLGLTICKEMVARNKGKIWAHSKLGQGTTVSFTVPRAEQTSG